MHVHTRRPFCNRLDHGHIFPPNIHDSPLGANYKIRPILLCSLTITICKVRFHGENYLLFFREHGKIKKAIYKLEFPFIMLDSLGNRIYLKTVKICLYFTCTSLCFILYLKKYKCKRNVRKNLHNLQI